MNRILILLTLFLFGCNTTRSLRTGSDEPVRLSHMQDSSDIVQDSTSLTDSTPVTPLINDSSIEKTVLPDTSVNFADIFEAEENPVHLVRISLAQKKRNVTIFSYGNVVVTSIDKRIRIKKGTIHFALSGSQIKVSAHGKSAVVTGPCDLTFIGDNSVFSYGKSDYRGALKILQSDDNSFSIINILPVEQYLRGVVPLEIGRKGTADSAAVQAQAVAARTYTYKRMEERHDWNYDLLPTVADQVYGGASAEHVGSDRAIEATEGKVLVYGGELVDALYHSTCGGYTASKEDVWGGVPFPYLKSRSDIMPNGAAYCGISPLRTWKEVWSVSDFSRLIEKYSKITPGQERFTGTVNGVRIVSATNSGRVTGCIVSGAEGQFRYGGDKIRFVFRRPVAGNGILYSSNFTISKQGSSIVAQGKGYGHGIGMCQMGAIGRARRGQSYLEILKAYYTNITIEDVDDYYIRREDKRE